jgi:hypothetical protein
MKDDLKLLVGWLVVIVVVVFSLFGNKMLHE